MEFLYDESRKIGGDEGLYQGYHILVKGVDKPDGLFTGDYHYAPHRDGDGNCTLYWNPGIVLDANGEAVVEFYCAAPYDDISITAEGITADGQAVVYKP